MKKIIVLMWCILLLIPSISITGATKEYRGKTPDVPGTTIDGTTRYVGGSGPGNYTSIQAAINDSSDGNTVYVYDDSSPYNENIRINKTVNLIGENKETTIIDGGGNEDVVTISRDYATLSGFTLKEPGWYYDGIVLSANNTVLEDLLISNVGYALTMRNANNNIIRDIEITAGRDVMRIVYSDGNILDHVAVLSSYEDSFFFIDSNHNQITNNTFMQGTLTLGNSHNNTIKQNIFQYTSGLSLSQANDNIIEENTFGTPAITSTDSYRNIVHNNIANGKPLVYLEDQKNQVVDDAGQVILIRCDGITVQHLEITSLGTGASISIQETTNSTITDNILSGGWYAILLDSSKKNQIINNTVKNTRYGIADQNGRSNVFSHNIIQDNEYTGIALGQSSLTRIEKNTITNNGVGIALEGGLLNTILGNTIEKNGNGILLEFTAFNKVKNNNFIKNTIDALFFNAVRTQWTRNYWGKLLPTPKIIVGAFTLPNPSNPFDIILIPFINIDKTPRLLPYKNT